MTAEGDPESTWSGGQFEATRDFLINDRRCTLRITVIDNVIHLTFSAVGSEKISVGSLAGAIALDDLIPVTKAISSALAGTAKTLGLTASEHSAHIAKVQEDHPSAYGPWTADQDERLIQRYNASVSLKVVGG